MNQGRYTPTRSVRIDDELWNRAKDRAGKEGVTISRATYLLVEGYALGLVNLPRVQLVYSDQQQQQKKQSAES